MLASATKSKPFHLLAKAVADVGSMQWLRTSGLRIGIILVVAVLISWIGGIAVRRMRRRLEGAPNTTQAANLQRATTIAHTLTNAVRVGIWTIAILMILDELGVNLAPLLAGAGVLGVALGFGAQSVVRDFLAGFYLLFENQFAVGDWVDITVGSGGGSFSGRVESLTLRHAAVRASDGTVYTIGNGNIMYVANRSRGRGRQTIELRLPAPKGISNLELALRPILADLRQDPRMRGIASSGPNLVTLEPSDREQEAVAVVAVETRPARRDQVEEELRRQIRQRLSGVRPEPEVRSRDQGERLDELARDLDGS